MNQRQPAWARDSVLLRLDDAQPVELTHDWAFGGATGEGVRVAVIDSGIEADHPLLDGCVDVEGAIAFTVADDGQVVATTGPHGDVYGHGTACAGIIHSLAPKATITSVRVLGPNLSGKAAAFHAGLEWAVEQRFDVINLSLGTTKKEWALAFHETCDRGYYANSFIVTAANNVPRPSYPSLFASVASVACNTTTDAMRFHANPEPPTEFLARGIDVEVAWINGTTTRTTGNSFAAPHIAGFAALLRSKHPELRPFHVKAALWAAAANVREAAGREPEVAEAAGRRSTHHAALQRATSMRATSMRATSMRASSLHGAPPAPPSSVRATLAPSTPATTPGSTPGSTPAPTSTPTIAPGTSGTAASRPDVETVARWRRLHALAHPHLLPVIGLDEARGELRSAEPGRSLRPILDGTEAPSADVPAATRAWRVAVIVAMASAVAALHEIGVVHGDLRPTDLSLDPAGRLLVGGATRHASRVDGSSARHAGLALNVANLRYASPEQLRDEPVTAATDVHALGLVACELLTGRLPYPPAERVGDLLRQRLGDDPLPLADLGGGAPAPIAAVLERALRVDPAARPPDAIVLARELALAAWDVEGEELAVAGPVQPEVVDALRRG